MSTTVHISDIASQTSEKEIRDFFSFCGKITNLSVTPTSNESNASKNASVTFEKETAAKTALLLDNTTLDGSAVRVTPAASLSELAGTSKGEVAEDEHSVSQEDKPRSRIVAEYLAHGYVISDKIIERALALDQQHGVSTKFTKVLTDFDSKYKATDKTKALDDKYAVSKNATSAWNTLGSYFDSALSTPNGQKLRKFYEQGNKQVVDVHNEARHLANLKSGKTGTTATATDSTATTAESAPAPFSAATTVPPVGSSVIEKPAEGDKKI